MDKIPHGWHLCDGTDGTPDLRDRFLQSYGSNAAKQNIEPGLPNIIGRFTLSFDGDTPTATDYLGWTLTSHGEGAFFLYNDGKKLHRARNSGETYYGGVLVFNASLSNLIYKDECNTVQPPAYTVYYIIKIK